MTGSHGVVQDQTQRKAFIAFVCLWAPSYGSLKENQQQKSWHMRAWPDMTLLWQEDRGYHHT